MNMLISFLSAVLAIIFRTMFLIERTSARLNALFGLPSAVYS